jgi:hypothetical protein
VIKNMIRVFGPEGPNKLEAYNFGDRDLTGVYERIERNVRADNHIPDSEKPDYIDRIYLSWLDATFGKSAALEAFYAGEAVHDYLAGIAEGSRLGDQEADWFNALEVAAAAAIALEVGKERREQLTRSPGMFEGRRMETTSKRQKPSAA